MRWAISGTHGIGSKGLHAFQSHLTFSTCAVHRRARPSAVSFCTAASRRTLSAPCGSAVAHAARTARKSLLCVTRRRATTSLRRAPPRRGWHRRGTRCRSQRCGAHDSTAANPRWPRRHCVTPRPRLMRAPARGSAACGAAQGAAAHGTALRHTRAAGCRHSHPRLQNP